MERLIRDDGVEQRSHYLIFYLKDNDEWMLHGEY